MRRNRHWIYYPIAAAVSAFTSLGVGWASRDASAAPAEDASTAAMIARLEQRLEALGTRHRELESELATARLAVEPDTGSRRSDLLGVDAAVARWMQQHAPALVAGSTGTEDPTEVDAALDVILTAMSEPQGPPSEFWAGLREDGRLEEVVAQLEGYVTATPYDPDLHTALAEAYVQMVFASGPGPEQGRYADLADASFGEALRLEPSSWRTRFGKALMLSNRPSFEGKSAAAIAEFETLMGQQEAAPPEARHTNTYFFLGNMYQDVGKRDEALATWRRGLERFPDASRLSRQIELFTEED